MRVEFSCTSRDLTKKWFEGFLVQQYPVKLRSRSTLIHHKLNIVKTRSGRYSRYFASVLHGGRDCQRSVFSLGLFGLALLSLALFGLV